MRRQSSYERYPEYARNSDHRYHEQDRAATHPVNGPGSGYNYETRLDSRPGYYDAYQYPNYNAAQYEYNRYAYPQSGHTAYPESVSGSRSRVDYSDYYGSMYKRYYEGQGRVAPNTAGYNYYRETAVGAEYAGRHPTNVASQRGENAPSTPAVNSERTQSQKARLYSFGYRKGARNLTNSRRSNRGGGRNANKAAASQTIQAVVEEKVEEVSPAIQNMAKLTLSMINYRIAQSLLSLNLTIGEEPIDSNLFSRVHASKLQAAEQNNATSQEAAAVPPSANSTTKVPNTSGSKRGHDHQSKNSHKGHPQSISAKRSLSATFDEVGREDHPHKRQRAQSAEEEGIVSEKAASDFMRDGRQSSMGFAVNLPNMPPIVTGAGRESSFGRHSGQPPSLQRSHSHESGGNSGRHHQKQKNQNHHHQQQQHPHHQQVQQHQQSQYQQSQHQQSQQQQHQQSQHQQSQHQQPLHPHHHQHPNLYDKSSGFPLNSQLRSRSEPVPAGYPSTSPRDYPMSRYGPSSTGPSPTHFDGYGQRADASAGAYPNYPTNAAQSSVAGYGGKLPRYYGSYDERERAEYGYAYPSNQGPLGREASTPYVNQHIAERMNYLPQHHATGDYNRQPTTTVPSNNAAGVNAAGYEYEDGEYRERGRPQSRAGHGNSIYAPTHQDFYGGAQAPTVYPETSIYGSRSSSAVNTPNHGSRDFYEHEDRRYPGQPSMHQGAPNSREHRGRENARHQRPNDALSRYAPSQGTPYHHGQQSHPSQGSAGGNVSGAPTRANSIPSLRTPR